MVSTLISRPGCGFLSSAPSLTQMFYLHLSSTPPPFLIRCKQGTLQFVILKPILATLSLILFTLGLLDIGDPSPFNGWIYIAIALNITYSIALTSLLQFYLGTRELLAVSEGGGMGWNRWKLEGLLAVGKGEERVCVWTVNRREIIGPALLCSDCVLPLPRPLLRCTAHLPRLCTAPCAQTM